MWAVNQCAQCDFGASVVPNRGREGTQSDPLSTRTRLCNPYLARDPQGRAGRRWAGSPPTVLMFFFDPNDTTPARAF